MTTSAPALSSHLRIPFPLCIIALTALTGWFLIQGGSLPGFMYWSVVLFLLILWVWTARVSQLFGPVLTYDLTRQVRRTRTFVIRWIYIGGLSALLFWIYPQWSSSYDSDTIPVSQLPRFVEWFFFAFLIVQALLVYFLTPAYAASAISEEKERKTLPFLLATDLTGKEIVFSKFVSRLAGIFLALLGGLPILSFLQFLGGIDPGLLLTAFAGTGIIVLSLASVGLFFSTFLRRTREAIILTYLVVPIYLLLTGAVEEFLSTSNSVVVDQIIYWFRIGNPFIAFDSALDAVQGNVGPGTYGLTDILRDFAIFHGVIIVICLLSSALNVRRVALQEASSVRRKDLRPRSRLLFGGRPQIGRNPVLWKEIYAEPGPRWHWLMRVVFFGAVIGTFLPALNILNEDYSSTWYRLDYRMNYWVRFTGTLVAGLLLLGVAIRGAVSMRGEKDRETYDALIITPLTGQEIIKAKWLGNIAGIGWGWLWLGGIWFLAAVTGGFNVIMIPFFLGCWFIYASCLSQLGIFFSQKHATTVRAIVSTVLVTIGISVGQFLLLACCAFSSGLGRGGEDLFLLVSATSPLTVLGVLQFGTDELSMMESSFFGRFVGYGFIGLFIWGFGTAILWGMNTSRFNQDTGRTIKERSDEPRRHRAGSSEYDED